MPVSPSEVASGACPAISEVHTVCGAAVGEVFEELRGLSIVPDDLIYGVCIVNCLLGLSLTFYQDERDAVDEEYDVGLDVLEAVELVLACDRVTVVLLALVVDQFDCLALFSGSEGDGAFIFNPTEELLVPSNIIGK